MRSLRLSLGPNKLITFFVMPKPKFRGNMMQTGRSPIRPTTTGGELWTYRTGKGIFSSPVIAGDGTVYLGSADRYFYALTPKGKVRWKFLAQEINDGAGLLDDHGHLYFGSGPDLLVRARTSWNCFFSVSSVRSDTSLRAGEHSMTVSMSFFCDTYI